jgi:hypothetical protein
VRFDLAKLLDPAFEPVAPAGGSVDAIGADPILGDGRYDAWVRAGSPHAGAP